MIDSSELMAAARLLAERGQTPFEPPPDCPVCGTPRIGRYCHQCGQDSHSRPQPLNAIVSEAAATLSPVDSKMVRTLMALAIRPFELLDAYRRGAGGLYLTPLKLFLTTSALFLALLNFGDVAFFQEPRLAPPDRPVELRIDRATQSVEVIGELGETRWMRKRTLDLDPRIPAAEEALAAAPTTSPQDAAILRLDAQFSRQLVDLGDHVTRWIPNALWLLMPVFALLLAPLFGRKRLLSEHLVFAMWAHAVGFTLLMVLAGLNAMIDVVPIWPVLLAYYGYVVVTAARYYDLSLFSAGWRMALQSLLYVGLVLIPLALIIFITGIDFENGVGLAAAARGL